MPGRLRLAIVLTAVLAAPASAAAQVNIDVNIGPPPVIFPAPPRVVAIPRTPVSYVPDTTYNVFVFENRYYSFHGGGWFVATGHRGPWLALAHPQVPPPVLAIPVRYYRDPPKHMPPGRAKKMDREGRGRGGHCPPGLARQGRC
jgi:hypothetical protein